jgi:replication factor A1
MNNILSIQSLFNLDYQSKTTYDIDSEFQIINISTKTRKNKGKEIFTATLTDGNTSYNKFLFCKEEGSPEIEIGQIIKIRKILPLMLSINPERVFLIKDFQITKKKKSIQHYPLIKDNHNLQIIENENENEKQNNSNINIENIPKKISDSYSNNSLNLEDESLTENISSNMKEQEILRNYIPLKRITTFTRDFTICVRIISKSEIKKFNTNRAGMLFTFIVKDEEGSTMQIVCFDKIVDKFYSLIKEDSVYEIKGGNIKINDKQYNTTNSDYKIILNEDSLVNEIEDNNKIKKENMNFLSTEDILSLPINSLVNVLCIVIDKGELIQKNTRNGPIDMKRTTISDCNGTYIELTLWKNFANLNIENGNILLIRKGRINDFGGKNITSVNESSIEINPEIKEYEKEINSLKEFYKNITLNNNEDNNKDNNNKINYIQKNKYDDKIVFIETILEYMDKFSNDLNHKFPFFKIKAVITHITHNDKNFYPGCPNKECQKKLNFENSKWICKNCKRQFNYPKYQYSLNIRVKDASSEYYVDLFGKTAENLLKMNAEEYRQLLIDRNDQKINELTGNIQYREFIFLLKVKSQEYNDVIKKKFTASKIDEVDNKEESIRLLNEFKEKLFN